MPAARKRNKGKERKAKKEEIEKLRIRKLWMDWAGAWSKCTHGCTLNVDDGHPLLGFMDSFFKNKGDHMNVASNLAFTFRENWDVWSNDTIRELTVDTLINIGANMILSCDRKIALQSVYIGNAIVILEHYAGEEGIGSIFYNPIVAKKLRDFSPVIGSCFRDTLKFLRKRTPCKCLKKLHLAARKMQPKMGLCYHCKEVRERDSLSACSICMVSHYCSRQCQVANWQTHKEEMCDKIVLKSRMK